MRPSKQIEVVANGVPAGRFTRFAWRREGKYLLRLIRIEVSIQQARPSAAHFSATAHYSYLLGVEKHTGYTLLTINLFGKSWLVNIAKKGFYVQPIHQETE